MEKLKRIAAVYDTLRAIKNETPTSKGLNYLIKGSLECREWKGQSEEQIQKQQQGHVDDQAEDGDQDIRANIFRCEESPVDLIFDHCLELQGDINQIVFYKQKSGDVLNSARKLVRDGHRTCILNFTNNSVKRDLFIGKMSTETEVCRRSNIYPFLSIESNITADNIKLYENITVFKTKDYRYLEYPFQCDVVTLEKPRFDTKYPLSRYEKKQLITIFQNLFISCWSVGNEALVLSSVSSLPGNEVKEILTHVLVDQRYGLLFNKVLL